MDENKEKLKGSESRDVFKQQHKEQCNAQFYSLDIDFALVEKNLGRGADGDDIPVIVAILDFKMPGDQPTFTEVLAYNRFVDRGIPVYIVESQNDDFVSRDPGEHEFDVYQYINGNWRPTEPTWEGEKVLDGVGWDEFGSWESELRITRRNRRRVMDKLNHDVENSIDNTDTLKTLKSILHLERVVKENPELLDEMYHELY